MHQGGAAVDAHNTRFLLWEADSGRQRDHQLQAPEVSEGADGKVCGVQAGQASWAPQDKEVSVGSGEGREQHRGNSCLCPHWLCLSPWPPTAFYFLEIHSQASHHSLISIPTLKSKKSFQEKRDIPWQMWVRLEFKAQGQLLHLTGRETVCCKHTVSSTRVESEFSVISDGLSSFWVLSLCSLQKT